MGILDEPQFKNRIKAVIFDMDGVLVDSEPAMARASVEALREFGFDVRPEEFLPYVGTGEKNYFGSVIRAHGGEFTPEIKAKIYETYCLNIGRDAVRFPSVPPTVAALKKAGYKLAIASSSIPLKVEVTVSAAGLDKSDFGAIVNSDDVVNLKPAPDIFLEAARRIGAEPHECFVCEDAENGVRAAKAGGMFCLGITSSFPASRLFELGADRCARDIGALIY